MQNKQLKIKVAILISVFVILVGVGIVSYSYTSFKSVDNSATVTQQKEDNDEDFLQYYMHAVYNRLFSGQ